MIKNHTTIFIITCITLLLSSDSSCTSLEDFIKAEKRIIINNSGEIYICNIKQIFTSEYLIKEGFKESKPGIFEIQNITKSKALMIMKIDDDILSQQNMTYMSPIKYIIKFNDGSYSIMTLIDNNYKPKDIKSLIPDDDAIVNLCIVNNLRLNLKLRK